MSELSEFKKRLDESSARIACAASATIHAECNRQFAELKQRLAGCQRLQQDMNTIYTVANLTQERDDLQAKLAAAEALLREAVENVTTVGLNGMHTSVLPSWLKRAKEVCGDN